MLHPMNNPIQTSRLRNQADFYSLFAAVVELQKLFQCPSVLKGADLLSNRLETLRQVERGELTPDQAPESLRYINAARAASNDAGPRRIRIDFIKSALTDL